MIRLKELLLSTVMHFLNILSVYFNHILIIYLNFDLNKPTDFQFTELIDRDKKWREVMCFEWSVCLPAFLPKKQVLTRVSRYKTNQEETGKKANVTMVSSQLCGKKNTL